MKQRLKYEIRMDNDEPLCKGFDDLKGIKKTIKAIEKKLG